MGMNNQFKIQNSKFSIHDAKKAFERSKVYKLFSYCFSEPNEELAEFITNEEFIRTICESFYCLGYKFSTEKIEILLSLDYEAIREEYIRFLILKSKYPIYENEYHRSNASIFSTEEMADIAGFYRAMGFTFSGERPDHIGAELEFMHITTLKEAEALLKNDLEKAYICRDFQKKFLQDHLGRWVNIFFEGLRAEGSIFYGIIGEILVDLINEECKHLNIKPKKILEYVASDYGDEEQSCLKRRDYEGI